MSSCSSLSSRISELGAIVGYQIISGPANYECSYAHESTSKPDSDGSITDFQ